MESCLRLEACGLRLSNEFFDVLHKPGSYVIGGSLKAALRIDPDYRLRIGGAQVYPIAVEFDLQSVIGIDRLVLVFSFDLVEDGRDIDPFLQLDLIFGNEIVGVAGAE